MLFFMSPKKGAQNSKVTWNHHFHQYFTCRIWPTNTEVSTEVHPVHTCTLTLASYPSAPYGFDGGPTSFVEMHIKRETCLLYDSRVRTVKIWGTPTVARYHIMPLFTRLFMMDYISSWLSGYSSISALSGSSSNL